MKQITIILTIAFIVFGCAHTPNSIKIQKKVSEYDDVNTFVKWLEAQPQITGVNFNKKLFLTTLPPKVIVTFFQNGVRHKLLLAVKPSHKLMLVKPE